MKILSSQRQAPPSADGPFLDWFVGEFMTEELRDFVDDLGPDTCRRLSLNGRRYAEHFGFYRDDLQAQFIFLMWTIGPDFWRFGGFARALEEKGLPPEDRIEALFAVPDDDAEVAIEYSDPDYWHPDLIEGNILGWETLSDDEDA